jgi:hypothetical protein
VAELIRDHVLEEALLAAVIADQNARPRSKQRLVGPSEIGGCRELVRAKIFEPEDQFLPDTHWHTAAHVGTVMGDDLERIFGERLGAQTQKRVTAYLDKIGLSISGAIDMIFIRNQVVCDLKGTGAFGSLSYEGGVKLDYYIQISVYVWGLVQAGILQPGASGRIVYYDRVGGEQSFIAVVVPWEAVLNYVELAQRRMQEILDAQAAIEAGQLSMAHALRDHVPSFCFSEKVQCPRRMHCWGGSDWAPLEVHDDAELYLATVDYIAGRRLENRGKAMKEQSRALLKGVEGHVVAGDQPGGLVGWKNGRISVVEIDALPAVQERVDEIFAEESSRPRAVATPKVITESGEVVDEGNEAEAGVLTIPDELAPTPKLEESPAEPRETQDSLEDSPGESEGRVVSGRVVFVDTDPRPLDETPFQGGGLVTAEEVQAWPTPAEEILEKHVDQLTESQAEYLRRKAEEAKQMTSEERLGQLQRDVAASRKARRGQ